MKRFLLTKELLSFSLAGGESPKPEEHKTFEVAYMWSSSHGKIIQKSFEKLPNGMLHGKSMIIDQEGKVFEIKEWKFGKLLGKESVSKVSYSQ